MPQRLLHTSGCIKIPVVAECVALGSGSHLSVESARPQEGGVKDVGAVGGRDHDDAGVALEAVHLRQQLVKCLLPLVIAATDSGAT